MFIGTPQPHSQLEYNMPSQMFPSSPMSFSMCALECETMQTYRVALSEVRDNFVFYLVSANQPDATWLVSMCAFAFTRLNSTWLACHATSSTLV